MIILDGKNLGERQHQLNNKINDAAKNKVDFNQLKKQNENSDVDKFFKIDLAAAYKDVDYILEILKCGDHLYISRALDKCSWLYDNDLKHIMNDDYLAKNIFPLMSIKMRKKTLTVIAKNLKNNDSRAVQFCTYCKKMNLYNIAVKFLIHAPNSFKLDVIRKKSKVFNVIAKKEKDYLENFIGDSFDLAENYINNFEFVGQKSNAIYLLRYMYSLSNEKYLDILESCDAIAHVLGRRISKHIIQHYKLRVMKKPLLYANVLKKDVIKRNIKIEEAKIFAVALLPDRSSRFYSDYYTRNKFVLDLIPEEEKFSFIKTIFNEKYKGEPFEASSEFYLNDLFDMMTVQEKETWALQNIASQNEILGSGNDYLWYKFVNFKKAFNELRKEVMGTTDNTKRCDILKVLIDSAKNEEDLTTVLNYFNERHRNETFFVTDEFLNKLIKSYKVWSFGENCWEAFEKILYKVDVFDKSKYQRCDGDYRVLALMYYVLNKMPVPEILNYFLEMNVISSYTLKKYVKNLSYETDAMFHYILQYDTDKIKKISSIPYDDNTKKKIRVYLRRILDLAQHCGKTADELPEIVLNHIKLDLVQFEGHKLLVGKQFSSGDIMRYLKKDATLVVTQFPQIQKYCDKTWRGGNINWLLHKLKVYFSHDISETYLVLFTECLSAESLDPSIAEIAVRGIFVLANYTRKIEFMDQYTPTDKTVDKANVSRNTLHIQEAICRQMLASRPPLPLTKVFLYITGDYVQYCLVLFRSFLVNLPQAECFEFVQKMINSPVSIQKHGLRLAFECFESEKLQMIILDVWNKTKNVSLRMVLYKQLVTKISIENDDSQLKLFEVLISLTLDLNANDSELLKQIDLVELPDHFVGRYLEAAWNTVSEFPEKPKFFSRLVTILKRMIKKLCFIPESFVDKIVNDHVHFMLDEEQIITNKVKPGFDDLLNSKWDLVISSLAYINNDPKLEKNIVLAKHIINKCIGMWNKVDEGGEKFVVRQFTKRFITDLDTQSYDYKESYSNFNILIQIIEQDLLKGLPEKEIYNLIWYLRSSKLTKNVILSVKVLELDGIKKSGIKLGRDFGMLIKESVEKRTFYGTFCYKIKKIIERMVQNFWIHIVRFDFYSSCDMLILFCLGLLENEIFETHMLALDILPLEYEGKFMDAYLSAINKMQGYQNTEIQYFLYEKFVNTDFKKRNYIN